MTESARYAANHEELQKQIFEQVHMWLRLNQETLRNHKPKVEKYESDHMMLDAYGVRGQALLVTRSHGSINGS